MRAAGQKADQAGTATYSIVMKTTIPGQGPVTIKGKGVSSLRQPLGRSSMTMAGANQNISMEVLMTSSALYMKFPKEMAQELGGKAWLKMSFADLQKASGLDLKALLEQSQQSSPTEYLKALVAAGDIKDLGTETVRGTATTHYSGTVTVQALTSAYQGELREQVAGLLKQMGTSPVKMDVWVAADGLPRRMRQVMTVGGNRSDMSMEFLRFGDTLDLTPPPATQTTDLATLMGKERVG
ncbi:MAG: hypothetical protein ABIM89_17050 [Mycobacteriales bacterium]